ncbi:MAG: hypothetical protein R2860_13535 [Desulfobacterales bacterium]
MNLDFKSASSRSGLGRRPHPFFTIEAIIRRPVSIKTREIAQQVGIFLLLMLMVFVFYNDIMRFFEK